jgi:8-oxo-dGTP diphosphatase
MINVTCAIIRNDGDEVLVVQRSELSDHPLKWEFPGGKLARGENIEECIIREVWEELSMDVVICGHLPEVEYDYGHKKIRLIPLICDTLDELPFLSEHVAYKWIPANDLISVDFSEADVSVANSYLERISPEKGNEGHEVPEKSQEGSDDLDLQDMVNNMMSMQEAEWVATSAIENQAIFLKLFEYSFSSDKRLAFRASWTLTKVCDRYPEMIYPYLPQIIEELDHLDNESAQRSFLRILSLTDLDKIGNKHHGILAEHCFNALRSGFSAIAVKAYSMEIIYQLALKYPELANELSASISMLQAEGSAGIIARGRIILKKLTTTPKGPRSSH